MSSTRKKQRKQAARPPITSLRPENQRLLKTLERLAAEPDDLGDEWWEEFRAWLRKNPVRFGGTDRA